MLKQSSVKPDSREEIDESMQHLLNVLKVWDGMVEDGIAKGARDTMTKMEMARTKSTD